MSAANRYGQYTDTPVDEAWFMKFEVLSLPTDHRKILNRQPVIRHIAFSNGLRIVAFLIDMKAISN